MDGVRRVPKPFVANGPSPGFLLAAGEQLRRGVIIELNCGLFNRDLFDRHLLDRDFIGHDFDSPMSAVSSGGPLAPSDKSNASFKPMNRARFCLKFRQYYC